jgi:hypothetical protein
VDVMDWFEDSGDQKLGNYMIMMMRRMCVAAAAAVLCVVVSCGGNAEFSVWIPGWAIGLTRIFWSHQLTPSISLCFNF